MLGVVGCAAHRVSCPPVEPGRVTVSGPGEDGDDRGELGRAHVVVVDQAGLALPGALVTVYGATSSWQRTADDEGIVVFDLPPGLYDASADVSGLGPVRTQHVEVRAGQTTSVIAVRELMTTEVLNRVALRRDLGTAYHIAELSRGIAIPTGVRHEPGAGPAVFVDGSTGIAYLPDRAVSDALLGVPGYLPGSGSLGGWSMAQTAYEIDGIRVDRAGRLGP